MMARTAIKRPEPAGPERVEEPVDLALEMARAMALREGGELVIWRVEGEELVALVDCGVGGIKKLRRPV